MDRDRMEPGRGKQPPRQDKPFPTRFGRNKRRWARPAGRFGASDFGERTAGEQRGADADDTPIEARGARQPDEPPGSPSPDRGRREPGLSP